MGLGAATSGQLGLHFGGIRQPSRNSDPETSQEAARKIQTSGQLTKQCRETLVALVRYEWAHKVAPTSHELAGDDLRLRYQYGRRLSDLEKLGLVTRLQTKRPCGVTGASALPWAVTEKGMVEFRGIQAERKAEKEGSR